MLERLIEAVLTVIMRVMPEKALPQKALRAQHLYIAGLDIKKRKTKKAFVVALYGLVGSGKSSVAEELAGHIGGTVIEGDAIRIQLRKAKERYRVGRHSYVRQISEDAALEVLKRGGNVIFDADFADERKRAALRAKLAKIGAKLVFVRTYAEADVVFGRIVSADYQNSLDDFFGGAKTVWKGGTVQQKGAMIKFKEAWRRTPQHYRWSSEGGGKWILKKPPVRLLADIDTTDPIAWKEKVANLAQRLVNL